jgi:hypothetical protein
MNYPQQNCEAFDYLPSLELTMSHIFGLTLKFGYDKENPY